jgi:hypothetical protein
MAKLRLFRWLTLDRATYFAQLATVGTLLATVVFSYFSWREAVEGRRVAQATKQQEQRFFVSQNAPEVELLEPRVAQMRGGAWVFYTFKNVGGSALRSPCVIIHDGLFYRGKKVQTSSCEGNNSYKDATIERDRTFMFYTPEALLGLHPDSFIVFHPGDPEQECKSPRSDLLLMDVSFYDVVGTKHAGPYEILVCGK